MPVLRARLSFFALLAALLLMSLPAAAEPLLVEKSLSPDSCFAVILKDGSAIPTQFKTTALYDVLQDPEMQEMLKPLQQTLANLYGQGKAMAPVPFEPLKELFSGELGISVIVTSSEKGPTPVFQIIAKPKDLAKAEDAVLKMLSALMAFSGVELPAKVGDTTRSVDPTVAGFELTARNETLLFTLWNSDFPEGEWHAQALSRLEGAAGGLSEDAEYVLARNEIDDDYLGWFYIGLPALERSLQGIDIRAMLGKAGLQDFQSTMAGMKIENRGFRSRAFVHIPIQNLPPSITAADLALIPMDSRKFTIGNVDLVTLYDRIMAILPKIDQRGELLRNIEQVEQLIGMSIRNDILGIFGKRCISFVSDPGSEALGKTIFMSVDDRKATEEKLTRALNAIIGSIRQTAGPNTDAFVRINSIDRGNFTQIYPQSVLPAALTPNFTVGDKWMGIGLSAQCALSTTRHMLQHDQDITKRADFAALMPRLPETYHYVGYTDVGECFDNLVMLTQMLSDLGTMLLKIASASGEMPLAVAPDSVWGMDPGRFPDRGMVREKLFGSITYVSYRPEGTLIDNFSPVGPLPVPAGNASQFQMQGLATTSMLAGMLLPAVAKAREEARRSNCMGHLVQIGKAILSYQQKNQDNLPPSLEALFPLYAEEPGLFICPSTNRDKSYAFIGAIPGNVIKQLPPHFMIAYDLAANHGTHRNVLHLDGHVSVESEDRFQNNLDECFDLVQNTYTQLGIDMPGSVRQFFKNP